VVAALVAAAATEAAVAGDVASRNNAAHRIEKRVHPTLFFLCSLHTDVIHLLNLLARTVLVYCLI
jgi:hypothetical protein